MNTIIFIVFSLFACARCQIFAPYTRTAPVAAPGCACANPAPLPVMKVPYEVPLPVMKAPYEIPVPVTAAVPRVVAKAPIGCLDTAVSPVGTITEAPLPLRLPIGNPFLPAASPVSALAPFSPLLPPANTCSRCQYLKKIPIPPPCI